MKRGVVLALLLTLGGISMLAASYQNPAAGQRRGGGGQANGPLKTQKVKDNLYIIVGNGGNTAVFITDGGVVVVDTKNPGNGQAILDQIKTVTPKPVTMIINTHTHNDHVGSNDQFPATVDFVAQENTKTNMTKMDAFKGENAKFLPGTTYKDKMSLGSGRDRIDLYYFGAAHTSGDTFVVFPALRVLHTGDMFAWKDGPLCDRNNGGSCVAFPQTLQKAIAEITNVDTVIPGHSPMQTPKDLQEYQKFTAYLVAYSMDLMKAGKSVADAAAGFKIDQYQGYKSERVQGAIQAVYDELKK